MPDPLLPDGDGHTPLSPDDATGLLPTYIATRGELYEAEQRSITSAMIGRSPTTAQLLDDKYLPDLHSAMLGDVWRWAGTYRTRETNLGIEPSLIPGAVRNLVADVAAWLEYEAYELDEIAVRFHHRLTVIHPFPNGNERHARICADLLAESCDHPAFSWGARMRASITELRAAYLGALRAADAGDMAPLVEFARS